MTTESRDSSFDTVRQILELILGERLDPTGELSPEMSLIYDLGFESIDFVLLLEQLQQRFAELPLTEYLEGMSVQPELRVQDLLGWIETQRPAS